MVGKVVGFETRPLHYNVILQWLMYWFSEVNLCVAVRLPWQPVGIKFTQRVTGQKSAFSTM